jgi:predicted aminopeptidase
MRKTRTFNLIAPHIAILSAALLSVTVLPGCSPFYVMRAAYEEGKILLGREEITEVIEQPETTPEIRSKLKLVLRSREFAEHHLGLNAKESFTQYSHVSKDVLAWVLLASKRDAFEPYTWWYPIVGTVPYKGYFHEEDAEKDIRRLEQKGYETWLRGTEAFSTLGWFNDPVLTTTLRHPPHSVANTVIHEIFHQTLWIKGSVDFNESAANAIGGLGAIDFFLAERSQCQDKTCADIAEERLQASLRDWEFEKELGGILTELHRVLEEVYTSPMSYEEKLTRRDEVFNTITAPFRARYPKMRILQTLNNAELLQLTLYRKQLPLFEEGFHTCRREWSCFVDLFRKVGEHDDGDPFHRFRELIEKLSEPVSGDEG